MVSSERWRGIACRDRSRVTSRAGRALFTVAVCLAFAGPLRSEDLAWQSDWRTAFDAAKTQRRLVFVDYFASWCGPCKVMEATVFTRPDVQKRLNDFVLLRLDVDKNRTLTRKQRVAGFPTYVVYDSGERERIRILGSHQGDQFAAALDQIESAAPSFVRASELYDADELQANFLIADSFLRLRLPEDSRKSLNAAKRLALNRGDKATTQVADIQSAFTWTIEGNSSRSIK